MVAGKQAGQQMSMGLERVGASKMGSGLIRVDFEVNVLLAPDGEAGQPVLLMEKVPSRGPGVGRKDARRGGEIRPGDLAARRAGRDADLRIVVQALVFSRVAAGHDVEFAIILREPDRRGDGSAGFAKGGERKIFLAGDGGRDRHGNIVWEWLDGRDDQQ